MLPTTRPSRPTSLDDLIEPALAARLSQLDLASRKVFAGKLKGERRSKKRGESVEFADHRPYATGDDLRHIDWHIFGRLDRLFLKLFLEEEDLSLHLMIDASASMGCGEPEKLLYAQRAAAALAYIGLVNMNRVALSAFGGLNTPPELRDLRGRRRVHDVARALCALEPDAEGDFNAAAHRLALARRGKGVMVVLSDFLFETGYERGLRLLAGRGYDLVAIQVLAPQELDPPLAGDLRLRDLESGHRVEITVSKPLLDQYHATLRAYTERLRAFCARRDITLITVSSASDVSTLLLDYLRARGVLR